MESQYKTFKDFYPFYLSEHSKSGTKLLHFIGTTFVFLTLIYSIVTQKWLAILLAPVFGYSFAWIGHFFVEKNRPATFTYPFYSLMGDFVMFKDIIIGKVKL
jgi:hypothetical protein